MMMTPDPAKAGEHQHASLICTPPPQLANLSDDGSTGAGGDSTARWGTTGRNSAARWGTTSPGSQLFPSAPCVAAGAHAPEPTPCREQRGNGNPRLEVVQVETGEDMAWLGANPLVLRPELENVVQIAQNPGATSLGTTGAREIPAPPGYPKILSGLVVAPPQGGVPFAFSVEPGRDSPSHEK